MKRQWVANGTKTHQNRCMTTLKPRQPPGSAKRRARAFSLQIADLQDQGYSLEAIREALADAGVTVSKSTVQREAVVGRRLRASAAGLPPADDGTAGAESDDGVSCAPQATPSVGREVSQTASKPAGAAGGVPSSGAPPAMGGTNSSRQAAADFVSGVITNPLMRRGKQ